MGGPKSLALDGVAGRLLTVTEHGIWFPTSNPVPKLRYFDFRSKSSRDVSPLGGWPYATVSTDERWAVYPRNDFAGTHLMVFENLR